LVLDAWSYPYTIISHGKCPFFVALLCLQNNNYGITLKKEPQAKKRVRKLQKTYLQVLSSR
jgi:hypothetical protein